MGLPKWRKPYGNGGSILAEVSGHSRNYTTSVIRSECEVIQRSEMRKSNLAMGRMKLSQTSRTPSIYHEVLSIQNLKYAYGQVSRKKGSNTRALDNTTLDGYSNSTIKSVHESLKDHSFKFKPIRKVYIPKPNGESRPIGIPSPRDKVLQKSMAMALEKIYESKFEESSHGFRPNRSVHTAIKQVTGWTGTR